VGIPACSPSSSHRKLLHKCLNITSKTELCSNFRCRRRPAVARRGVAGGDLGGGGHGEEGGQHHTTYSSFNENYYTYAVILLVRPRCVVIFVVIFVVSSNLVVIFVPKENQTCRRTARGCRRGSPRRWPWPGRRPASRARWHHFSRGGTATRTPVQGYLAHKKQPPSGTLQ